MRSIGQILKQTRTKKNYSIDDIHKHLKISTKFINAMESDDFTVFHGKVHSKGFLKMYGEFLGADVEELMALWRREYERTFDDKDNKKIKKTSSIEPEKFIITPQLIFFIFLIIVTSSFFFYLFWQYKNFTDAPVLEIFYPEDNQVLDDDVLDLTGKTDLDSEVSINNQKIIINPDGNFLTSIKLREGINTISIKAVNKLGKSTEKLKTIIYRPEEPEVIEFKNLDIGTTSPQILPEETSEKE